MYLCHINALEGQGLRKRSAERGSEKQCSKASSHMSAPPQKGALSWADQHLCLFDRTFLWVILITTLLSTHGRTLALAAQTVVQDMRFSTLASVQHRNRIGRH